MGQQLAIIVLVDVPSALKAKTLKGNTYLFDNMKLQGSENEGTGDLVTAVNGTSWRDGSIADEQILNWLPYSLGSIPPTVPRSYHTDRARDSDQEALEAISDLVSRAGTSGTDVTSELNSIHKKVGVRTRRKSIRRNGSHHTGHKLLDVTGEVIESPAKARGLNFPAPVITDVIGEAVDKKIIYPAIYGSPDLVSDGWYWSASVDTSTPGTFGYTMVFHLHRLISDGEDWIWEPVSMSFDSSIKITSAQKYNGFTRAGVGLLPIS